MGLTDPIIFSFEKASVFENTARKAEFDWISESSSCFREVSSEMTFVKPISIWDSS